MKVFICLLVLVASANAGILAGGVGGYAYGGGLDHGHVHQASIVKVIHEHAPAAIVKVIHEEGPSIGLHQHHQLVEAAPQIVQVVHEDHGHAGLVGHAAFAVPAPVVHHVKVIHEHAGGEIGGLVPVGGVSTGGELIHAHGGVQEVKFLKVIQQDLGHHVSHGWA